MFQSYPILSSGMSVLLYSSDTSYSGIAWLIENRVGGFLSPLSHSVFSKSDLSKLDRLYFKLQLRIVCNSLSTSFPFVFIVSNFFTLSSSFSGSSSIDVFDSLSYLDLLYLLFHLEALVYIVINLLANESFLLKPRFDYTILLVLVRNVLDIFGAIPLISDDTIASSKLRMVILYLLNLLSLPSTFSFFSCPSSVKKLLYDVKLPI